MSATTNIEWTDATWNPVTGCTQVSEGCGLPRQGDTTHGTCYALTFAERWRGTPGHHFEHGFDLQLRPDKLTLPLVWRKPRRVFVNSMSDLFHADVPDTYIAEVFTVMALARQHTFQILTKRPARMRSLLSRPEFVELVVHGGITPPQSLRASVTQLAARWITTGRWPLRNVWLGVSVETQQWADIRIPPLLQTPAAVRFLSCEPLLGPVDLDPWLTCDHTSATGTGTPDVWECDGCGAHHHEIDDPTADLVYTATAARRARRVEIRPGRNIDWVIVGGESGPGARPMHPDWTRSLRDQCTRAGCRFLFKQWGNWAPVDDTAGHSRAELIGRGADHCQIVDPAGRMRGRPWRSHPVPDGAVMRRYGKTTAGRVLDGRTWDEYPQAVTA